MEDSVLKSIKKVLESLATAQTISAELTLEEAPQKFSEALSNNSLTPMGSVSEGILAQNIPKSSFHPGLLSDNLFHLKNLNTGQELALLKPGESFFAALNELINEEKYSEAMDHISEQKSKMNAALWQASGNGDFELCRILLDKKTYGELAADANSRNSQGQNALHISASLGLVKVCEILLDYGHMTDLNAKDPLGRTPLHLACVEVQLPAAQLLLRSGAHINVVDELGNTPTHYAVEKGDKEFLSWILYRYPDLSIKNRSGKTPLDLVSSVSIQELMKISRVPPPVVDLTPQHVQIINTGEDEASSILRPPVSGLRVEDRGESKKVSARDFEAIQLLGKGSFGEVYLVEHKKNKELYAMKILMKSKIMGQNLVKYAMTERNVLSYIKHPFIVGLKYAFQTSSKLFLILDYCPGGSMAAMINREKRFTENRARIYLCEILLAIEELHRRDIIYRDLKPDNIVLDEEGHALLTDFGLSKEGIMDNHSAHSFCGSVAYLAPEMLKRQGHGKSVDWYLLGVLFYEMIVGFPPYFSTNREQMFSNIQKGKLKIPTSLSVDARSLLKELLNRDPLKRLGCRRDAEEIKDHPFFYGINWESTLRKELRPPRPNHTPIIPGSIPQENIMGSHFSFDPATHISGWTFISS
jgi:protein-serine/threonine kinase